MATWIVWIVLIAFIYTYHSWSVRHRAAPKGIEWSGLQAQWFAKSRASVRDWQDAPQVLTTGYRKYNRRNIPFISPTYHRHPEVILPRSYLKWLVDQPDHVLSIGSVLQEDLHFRYTSPGSWAFTHAYHVEALNKMRLDPLTPGLIEEIATSFDILWGTEENEWITINPCSTIAETLLRVTNRATVGLPVCHNREYHDWIQKFMSALALQSMIISIFVPVALRPLLARILAIPCRRADRKCAQLLVPIISERLKTAQRALIDPSYVRDDRDDLLDWTVKLAAKSSDSRDLDPHAICSRLLSLSFVGVHTSIMTAVNFIFELAAAPPSVLAKLRHEAEQVYVDTGGIWSKAAVARLVYMDSAFRESLRLCVFKARGVERQVIAPDGVSLPDGTHLPYGTRVGLSTMGIQHDGDIYPHATLFVPFRFVDEEHNMSMVNTSDAFLAFGHGRHACPGRFFAAHELKLLMAHVVMNYDIEPLETRPANSWSADFSIPPEHAPLRVKRRKHGHGLGGCRSSAD